MRPIVTGFIVMPATLSLNRTRSVLLSTYGRDAIAQAKGTELSTQSFICRRQVTCT